MTQFALSSWSVHGLLGKAHFNHQTDPPQLEAGQAQGSLSLLELPALAAENGIDVLEICHFHFPSVADAYLLELKAALAASNVVIENILVDMGNLSNPDDDEWRVDVEKAKKWQRIAAQVGAKGNRIDCGTEQPTPASINRAVSALRELGDYANDLGIYVTTENFRPTSQEADDLIHIIQQLSYPIKLCVDFGNAEKTADKFWTLKQLMPFATSIHCKANYEASELDLVDLHRALSLLTQHGFVGPITLIYNETENEWAEIIKLRDAVAAFLSASVKE